MAIVAMVAVAVAGFARFSWDGGERIARLWVSGVILDDPVRDGVIATLRDDNLIKAVVVRLDSPGGSAVGGEALYLSLRQLAETKPLVTVMGTTATSAAYLAAVAADHIFARESTLTGSIGVLFQTAEFTALLEEIGIQTEGIRGGPLKARPSPVEPLDARTRDAMENVVMDIYEVFLNIVIERRSLDRRTAEVLADGRVFTGKQAHNAGLIDAIGGEEAARKWLAETHGVSEKLPVKDADLGNHIELLSRVGIAIDSLFPSYTLALDGLIAVWHPALAE